MVGPENPLTYYTELKRDPFRICFSLQPKSEKFPDLLKSGSLGISDCVSNPDGSYIIVLKLSEYENLSIVLKETYLYFEGKYKYFQLSQERDCCSAPVLTVKKGGDRFIASGELFISFKKVGTRDTWLAKSNTITQYIYTFRLELTVNAPNRALEQNMSTRPVINPPLRSASSPDRNSEVDYPSRTLRKSVTEEPGRIAPEMGKLLDEMSKMQTQLATMARQNQELKSRIDLMENKITTIHESICYEGENKIKAFTLSLQKIFQDQAQKKLALAKRELKALDSDPILHAMDEILSILHNKSVLYQRFMTVCPRQEILLDELVQLVLTFRQRFLPDRNIKIPEFDYKTFAQFLRSDYKQYLLNAISIDREPDDDSLEPIAVYRKCAWRESKKNLDEFNPVFTSNVDYGQLQSDWNPFLFKQFLPGLRRIEQVEEISGGNPAVSQVVNELFSAILDPLDLELLPVQIGECFDPKKHDKDPYRSANRTSTVSRVLNRGVKFKNRDEVWVQAKVTIG